MVQKWAVAAEAWAAGEVTAESGGSGWERGRHSHTGLCSGVVGSAEKNRLVRCCRCRAMIVCPPAGGLVVFSAAVSVNKWW